MTDRRWRDYLRGFRALFRAAFIILLALGPGQASTATASEPSAQPQPPPSQPGCQDRFRVERVRDPENALRNFRQCNAIQDISANLEDFIFWYVTLPTTSRPNSSARLQQTLNHNMTILTGSFIRLEKPEAAAVVGSAITRGLKRAARDDLVAEWKSTHSAAILNTGEPVAAPERSTATGERLPRAEVPPVRPVKSESQPVSAAPVQPERVASGPALRRPKPHPRHDGARYSRSDAAAAVGLSRSDELNREQRDAVWYSSATPAVAPYYPPATATMPAQIPAVVQQQAYQPYAAPAVQQAPPPSAGPAPSSIQPEVQPQFYYSPVAQQIEKNVRTITGLIDENIRTVQQAIFGRPLYCPAWPDCR